MVSPYALLALGFTSPRLAGELLKALGVTAKSAAKAEDYIASLWRKVPEGMVTDGLNIGTVMQKLLDEHGEDLGELPELSTNFELHPSGDAVVQRILRSEAEAAESDELPSRWHQVRPQGVAPNILGKVPPDWSGRLPGGSDVLAPPLWSR